MMPNSQLLIPPSRRPPCRLTGLLNQGATCYLNALVQTLLFTPEFRVELFKIYEELCLRSEDKTNNVPLQLTELFSKMLLLDRTAIPTKNLTDSFGWTKDEILLQQDVQEFNRNLFHILNSSLENTSGSNIIRKLYHGTTITTIKCQNCGKISERDEEFQDLNVIVDNFSNLQDSFYETFRKSELLHGANKFLCSTCCKLVDANKDIKIKTLPPILTLCLLRFNFDTKKLQNVKYPGEFIFPFELDMAPYCLKVENAEDSQYELYSIVIHSGTASSGHYHAFIWDLDSLGNWPESQDEKDCDLVSLIRAILLEKDDNFIPIDLLYIEIKNHTGLSWNKKFKSSHGTIAKFLENHNDTFQFDKMTNLVGLKIPTIGDEPIPKRSRPSTSHSDSPKVTRKHPGMNKLKLNTFDRKKDSNIRQNWFDFNDSYVSPICLKDIETQYAGNESAYLLFYRRKSLLRPEEAKGNPKFKIPEKLLRLVEEDNLKLERLREDYETVINTVNLQIHLGNNYRCSNGVLKPELNEVNFVSMSIDQRKILLDLRDSISKICSELYPDQHLVMYTTRNVPGGLHLYEELSESKNFENLKDLGITEGTNIFVWDGSQIRLEQVDTLEPVLLNISAKLEVPGSFKKTTTVGELKVLTKNIIIKQLEDIKLYKIDFQGEKSRLSFLNENQDLCTLSELGFIDGDNIVAESFQCQNVHRKKVNEITVVVSNCCQGTTTSENGIPQTIELTVELDNTIEELRCLAVSQLNLDASRNFILRKYLKPQSRRPPLHENETMRENGLVNNSLLTIEEGNPPEKDQITVMFTVGIGTGDPVEHEVTLNKNVNVQDCLRKMLDVAGLNGDAWHLRKTNWRGEPMEQLSLDGMTLEDESVQHGQSLLIMEGRLPAKDFLFFFIWLFSTIETITNPQSMNTIHSGIESLLQNFGRTSQDNSSRNIKLGEIEISSDSTVMDLKTRVLSLPMLTCLSLPSIRYLRLQLLDNERPGKVLRGLQSTLSGLNLKSSSLAVRILGIEEDLKTSEILLNVCQHIPDTKSYTPPSELVWDTSKSSTTKSLKKKIADCTGFPIHRLIILKYFPDKCQWVTIDDKTNSTLSKETFSKRISKKSSLKLRPYFLKDGDTIGLKYLDSLSDLEDTHNTVSTQDINCKSISKEAAENKRIKVQCSRFPNRVDVHRKENEGSPEKVITIYGSPDNCSTACKKIMEMMQQETNITNRGEILLKMLAPNRLIGRIIGKSGSTIKRIMEQSKTIVAVSSSWNLEHTVKGKLENIGKAEKMISSKLRQSYENDLAAMASQTYMYPVVHPMAMMTTQPPMAMMTTQPPMATPQPRASLPMSLYTMYGGPGACVGPMGGGGNYLQGPMPPPIETQKETVYVYIPNSVVGAIIGKGGRNITEMISCSGASIQVIQPGKDEPIDKLAERKVCVIGTPDAQWKAQFMIFKKVDFEGYRGPQDATLKVEISVPTQQVGRIIGKGGYMVKELQRVTHAIVKFPKGGRSSETEETAVHIIGDFYCTMAAQRQIRSLVYKSSNAQVRRRMFRPTLLK